MPDSDLVKNILVGWKIKWKDDVPTSINRNNESAVFCEVVDIVNSHTYAVKLPDKCSESAYDGDKYGYGSGKYWDVHVSEVTQVKGYFSSDVYKANLIKNLNIGDKVKWKGKVPSHLKDDNGETNIFCKITNNNYSGAGEGIIVDIPHYSRWLVYNDEITQIKGHFSNG